MTLAEKLRRARNAAGLTQDDVAEEMGVTKATVSGWESTKRKSRPDLERLPELCDLYGITLDALLRPPGQQRHAVAETPNDYIGQVDRERRVLARLRKLKPQQREAFLRLLETL